MVTLHACDCQDVPGPPQHIQTCSTYSDDNLLSLKNSSLMFYLDLPEKYEEK